MVQSIADQDVTVGELKQNFGIQIVQDATFFPEWLDGLERNSSSFGLYVG